MNQTVLGLRIAHSMWLCHPDKDAAEHSSIRGARICEFQLDCRVEVNGYTYIPCIVLEADLEQSEVIWQRRFPLLQSIEQVRALQGLPEPSDVETGTLTIIVQQTIP